MVKQPGATCPGSPGGATAGLGQAIISGNDDGGKALADEATHPQQINVAPGLKFACDGPIRRPRQSVAKRDPLHCTHVL